MPERIGDTSVLTTVHLVLIVILAVLAVGVLVWGARLKRQRRAAEEVAEEQAEAIAATDEPLDRPEAAREPEAASGLAADTGSGPPPPVTAATPVARDRQEDRPAPVGTVVANSSDVVDAPTPIADEPIAAVSTGANPAAEAASAPASAAAPADAGTDASADPANGPVTQLKGLGPKLAQRLNELGIHTVGDLARLDDGAAEALDARLGPFTGRMGRDRWLEQARFLAAGDRRGFEAVFGRL